MAQCKYDTLDQIVKNECRYKTKEVYVREKAKKKNMVIIALAIIFF